LNTATRTSSCVLTTGINPLFCINVTRNPPPTRYWRYVHAVEAGPNLCTLCGRQPPSGWLFQFHQLQLCDDVCVGIALRRFGALFGVRRKTRRRGAGRAWHRADARP
jgi:hypothetical protein